MGVMLLLQYARKNGRISGRQACLTEIPGSLTPCCGPVAFFAFFAFFANFRRKRFVTLQLLEAGIKSAQCLSSAGKKLVVQLSIKTEGKHKMRLNWKSSDKRVGGLRRS